MVIVTSFGSRVKEFSKIMREFRTLALWLPHDFSHGWQRDTVSQVEGDFYAQPYSLVRYALGTQTTPPSVTQDIGTPVLSFQNTAAMERA